MKVGLLKIIRKRYYFKYNDNIFKAFRKKDKRLIAENINSSEVIYKVIFDFNDSLSSLVDEAFQRTRK